MYVDEYTCIGCTHCNHEAPSTFFMEEEFGRARVYQQGRDTEDAVSMHLQIVMLIVWLSTRYLHKMTRHHHCR